ncbi:CK1/TTBK protein kinase [Thecamonas trahens ATCC 50062]|uniref:CK1/TTBK protein kinase n=1 Tax=Thecamonas trahens ATCC 50062 TaxID=461836 RepID=A0A0L0DTW4_THETB|nr:CK1/TTBK protein kinase [Thecamonas trahens ATCC 50062]KNC55774.1 CK1/TTBK protein kinase [Thecamonas trahens ATCC 50062]|eukprot:XP_013752856.1 CK1/TTBK protein kinase [Thecamonas trahens ATCC 50062]
MQAMGMEERKAPLLAPSALLRQRWKVIDKIGQGAFGEIYRAMDVLSQELVAIKSEEANSKKQVLKLEVAVIKKMQGNPAFCRFIYCGRHANVNYVVMDLLGENLSDLRRKMGGKFSIATTARLTLQLIRGIQAIHEQGYLHRDIKSSNFAMGRDRDTAHQCYIIDFGLARRYLLPNGQVRPPRETTGFRGTARYASINSHLGRELGRRDDLYSLLYVCIEFMKGSLPWRRIRAKEEIGQMKLKIRWSELLSNLPLEFLAFSGHLDSLDYADEPDYDRLCSLIRKMCKRLRISPDEPYDWERRTQYTDRSGDTTTLDLNSSNHLDAGAAAAGGEVLLPGGRVAGAADAAPAANAAANAAAADAKMASTPAMGNVAKFPPAAAASVGRHPPSGPTAGSGYAPAYQLPGNDSLAVSSRTLMSSTSSNASFVQFQTSLASTGAFESSTSRFADDFASLEAMPTASHSGAGLQLGGPLVGVAVAPSAGSTRRSAAIDYSDIHLQPIHEAGGSCSPRDGGAVSGPQDGPIELESMSDVSSHAPGTPRKNCDAADATGAPADGTPAAAAASPTPPPADSDANNGTAKNGGCCVIS